MRRVLHRLTQGCWKSPKSLLQWSGSLSKYVYPALGSLPVQTIDVALVMRAIEPIWTEKPETANRIRGRIESVLDWATARGYRTGENPARWRGHLDNLLPSKSRVQPVEHHPALPYREIAGFITELRSQDGVAARALEFAILTAARSAEAMGAQWNEMNLADEIWSIPAERMKGGREHRTPLCGRALEILRGMYAVRYSNYVFPGQRHGQPIGRTSFFDLLRQMGRND